MRYRTSQARHGPSASCILCVECVRAATAELLVAFHRNAWPGLVWPEVACLLTGLLPYLSRWNVPWMRVVDERDSESGGSVESQPHARPVPEAVGRPHGRKGDAPKVTREVQSRCLAARLLGP
jgi:hypothetical protein